MRVLGTCALAVSFCTAGELCPPPIPGSVGNRTEPHRNEILSAGKSGRIWPSCADDDDPLAPRPPAAQPPPSGPVSVHSLKHRPPKPARRAWDQVRRHLNAGRLDRASAYAEEAVRHDPEFTEAIEFLAAVLLHNGNSVEGEAYASRALQVDPASARAHWFCALAQLRLGPPTADTRRHLEAAARVYPKAQEFLTILKRGL